MESSRRKFLGASAALAAGAGLPRTPGEPKWIAHDLHTHTVYSDGAHPVDLHVLEARAFELEAVAITDHYTPQSRIGKSEEEFARYLEEIERARSGQEDVLVLKGAEAAVLDPAGRITLDERHAAKLEWVLCDLSGSSEGILKGTPADKAKYVENVVRAYLALCDVPWLDAIAHPFNTGNTNPPAIPEDYPRPLLKELASKMAEKGKVFDVMNDTVYWFQKSGVAPRTLTAQYVDLVKVFAAAGVRFQVSSDDHRTGLGNTRWSQLVLSRAGVPAGQVVDPAKIRRR